MIAPLVFACFAMLLLVRLIKDLVQKETDDETPDSEVRSDDEGCDNACYRKERHGFASARCRSLTPRLGHHARGKQLGGGPQGRRTWWTRTS